MFCCSATRRYWSACCMYFYSHREICLWKALVCNLILRHIAWGTYLYQQGGASLTEVFQPFLCLLSHASQRVVSPASLFSSIFSISICNSCQLAAAVNWHIQLFRCGHGFNKWSFKERFCCWRCWSDRQSLGLTQVWLCKCHKAFGAVRGCPGTIAAQVFFLSSPLHHRPI